MTGFCVHDDGHAMMTVGIIGNPGAATFSRSLAS